VVSKIDSVKLL